MQCARVLVLIVQIRHKKHRQHNHLDNPREQAADGKIRMLALVAALELMEDLLGEYLKLWRARLCPGHAFVWGDRLRPARGRHGGRSSSCRRRRGSLDRMLDE